MVNYSEIFNEQGMDYQTYRALVDQLLLEGKSTSEASYDLHYTKMNVQRMNRVDKTVSLTDDLISTINQLKGNYKFLVITEGWCGDAAQIIPVFNKIATASLGRIDLKFVLRDKNLPLIDAHLTNGGRAIPVLIVLNESADQVLATWAPRPKILQELLKEWKKETIEMPILAEKLHGWYAKDKTQSTQAELNELLKGLEFN
ncbi:thioredoxin-like protein [Pedobacter psychrotolerans]|uniref:Thioredoxin n=2 Tax=Pedobacter psychrotolerans TaxID=1843235 RepID=A0A4R2HIQ4_9SPHI|nr:thioredoxin family protein [Pedobacter psychrotolerans]TCO29183.1 thioredoxin-like protein [Pedobacter psychrotolerans]GGE54831.1 thioredoxin [Pedobacter psychrotolerans]